MESGISCRPTLEELESRVARTRIVNHSTGTESFLHLNSVLRSLLYPPEHEEVIPRVVAAVHFDDVVTHLGDLFIYRCQGLPEFWDHTQFNQLE